MLSLKSEIGRKVGPYREEVTQDRITAFCRAVGSEEGLVAPPTFLTVFRNGEFELFHLLQIELAHVLHAEQDYQYENTIHAGDIVQFETTVTNVLEKKGATGQMQFITFESQYQAERKSKPDPVAIGKSKTTIVIRTKNGD